MKKRDKTIDIAKAIGIICVVLGHTQFRYSQLLYQFHLPLFFFLSGAVFNLDKYKNLKTLILKKIKTLYLPFIKFEIIFLILHNFFTKLNFYTAASNVILQYDLKHFLINLIKILTMGGGEQLAGPLWFLISSFEITIIYAVMIWICKKNLRNYYINITTISLILYFIGCYSHFPRMLSQSLIGLLFYSFGFMYKEFRNVISFKPIYVLITSCILVLCSMINYIDISKLQIDYKLLLILSGLSGIYVTIYISKKIAEKGCKLLQYIGKNTIYILALHCISFKTITLIEYFIYKFDPYYIGKFPTFEISQSWTLLYVMCGIFLPILIKMIVDKISIIWRNKNVKKIYKI